MTVEPRFQAVGERLLDNGDGVERGRMLRALGLKADGRFSAFARDDELTVRLSPARVSELIGAGVGRPFRSGNRTMKGWVALAPPDLASVGAYVDQAKAWTATAGR